MTVAFSKKLDEMLREKGISQSKLAKSLGIAPQQISQWVKGKNYPSFEKFLELISVSGKDANYFCGFPSKSPRNTQFVGDNNRNINQTYYGAEDMEAVKQDLALLKRAVLDLQRKVK